MSLKLIFEMMMMCIFNGGWELRHGRQHSSGLNFSDDNGGHKMLGRSQGDDYAVIIKNDLLDPYQRCYLLKLFSMALPRPVIHGRGNKPVCWMLGVHKSIAHLRMWKDENDFRILEIKLSLRETSKTYKHTLRFKRAFQPLLCKVFEIRTLFCTTEFYARH